MEQRRLSVALVAAFTLIPAIARAEVEMPRRNPPARVSQLVGLTEIAVDYNSPAVHGRPIWGAVVPNGELWSTGDHPAARITFGKDVSFGGQKVPAGTYALLAIPGPAEWTLVLNRNAGLADKSRDYRPEQDAARVKARAQAAAHRERLTFLFSDFTDERASLDLEWEKLRVSVPIEVDTRAQVLAGIRALDNAWRAYAEVARYMLETKKDYDAGLAYVDKSLALSENPQNTALKAALLAARGQRGGKGRRAAPAPASLASAASPSPSPSATATRTRAPEPKTGIDDPPAPGTASTEPPPVPTLAVMVPDGPATEPKALPPAVDPPAFQPGSAPAVSLAERPERRAPVHAPAHATASTATTMPEPGQIAPIIQRGRADIQSCYQRALRHDPTLVSGKITISIGIGSSGTVKSVALDAPRPLRALEPCIKDAVSRWAFPLSSAEYGTELPIVLQGRE